MSSESVDGMKEKLLSVTHFQCLIFISDFQTAGPPWDASYGTPWMTIVPSKI